LNVFRNERDLLKYFFLQKIRKSKQPEIEEDSEHPLEGFEAV
jgi:hypothetical protein